MNSVFFSSSVFGEAFGKNAIAITVYYYDGGNDFTEADVLFNSAVNWDTYRGPLQGSGPYGHYDFHRVALHEFGHVLGLDHPDEHGQNVVAIMNSIISDLDHLADDDIAGVGSLYALPITSSQQAQTVRSGDPFSYQITANNQPTSFSAAGLPPGLQVDPATGLISGNCLTSGSFVITISATGDLGVARGSFHLTVSPLLITSSLDQQLTSGQSFFYQITAWNTPTSFSATGLPAGLSLDPASGIISGTPTVTGAFYVIIKADGANSEASGTLVIDISPPRINSIPYVLGDLGSHFSYQITATNNPTSYFASGLPPGLQLDPATGLISGVIELSGSFNIQITARGPMGDVTGYFLLNISSTTNDTPYLAKIPVGTVSAMVPDAVRGRLYLAVGTSVVVVDANALIIEQTIPTSASTISSMCLSADGSKLWMTEGNSQLIGSIDLDALTQLPDLKTTLNLKTIQAGADGHLYIVDYTQPGFFQVDSSTGATLAHVLPTPSAASLLISPSPDHKDLYVGAHNSPILARYDIASDNSPILKQQVEPGTADSYTLQLTVAPDGQSVLVTTFSPSENYGTISILSASDLGNAVTDVQAEYVNSASVYSSDGSLVFLADHRPEIDVYSTATGAWIHTITLPSLIYPAASSAMVAIVGGDLFLLSDAGYLLAYQAAFPSVASVLPPPAHSLLNVATRLRAETGDNVLIGGFIISGNNPKQVLLRAIGPSLPVQGALADPTLELHAADGTLIGSNDNWNEHRADVLATGIPPTNEREAALVTTLPPGAYTAIVSGVGNTTGVALVELYDLDANSGSRIANISTRGEVETDDNVMMEASSLAAISPRK